MCLGLQPFGRAHWQILDESKRNFEVQRDKEFAMHVCTDHPRAQKARAQSMMSSKIGKRLYRAAIIESDRSKLLQRVEDVQAAILGRSRSLSKSPANSEKEQKLSLACTF